MSTKFILFILVISSILCGLPGALVLFIGVITLFPEGYSDSMALESGLTSIGVGIGLLAIPIGIFILYCIKILKPKTPQINSLQPPSLPSDDPVTVRIKQEIRNLTYKEIITNNQIAVVDLQRIQGIRANAAVFLGNSGDIRAVEPLIAASKYKDTFSELNTGLPSDRGYDRVLEEIATALGKLKDVRAVEPLISISSRMYSFHTGAVVKALEQFGEPAIKSLIVALRNDDYRIRGVAAEALGNLGGVDAVRELMAVVEDENLRFEARTYAAIALGKLGDARAVEPLTAALKNADYDLRQRIIEVLQKLDRQPSK